MRFIIKNRVHFVICRVGSLEIGEFDEDKGVIVICRVGSLEIAT